MSVRKRIRLERASTGGGGAPVPPAPGGAIAWTPADGDVADAQHEVVQVMTFGDPAVTMDLAARQAVTMPALAIVANTGVRQAVAMPSLATTMNLRARGALSLIYTIQDAQPKDDTFFDENSPATIHGSTVGLLAKTNAAVGSNRQHTYIAFDLTGVSGTVSNANVKLRISTTAILGETVTYTVFTHPTQPFVESTANWTNSEPPPGTSRGTITQAVTTTATVYTINFNATQMTNMPGNWVYLRCTGGGALASSTITTTSKEAATTTDRPRITLTVTV